jgi:hypothetical protein
MNWNLSYIFDYFWLQKFSLILIDFFIFDYNLTFLYVETPFETTSLDGFLYVSYLSYCTTLFVSDWQVPAVKTIAFRLFLPFGGRALVVVGVPFEVLWSIVLVYCKIGPAVSLSLLLSTSRGHRSQRMWTIVVLIVGLSLFLRPYGSSILCLHHPIHRNACVLSHRII